MAEAKQVTEEDDLVSMAELKELARQLPPNSTARSIILSEPDKIPKSELQGKLMVFVKLVHKELFGMYADGQDLHTMMMLMGMLLGFVPDSME